MIGFLSRLTFIVTFILIFAGGMVTSTDSGLAVPDWPLSFGTLFPRMVGGIFFEHSHRMIAGLVLILTVFLTVAIWRQAASRVLKVLITLAMGLVLVQALLGGLTVLFLLPKPISMTHATMGQMFFTLMGVLVLLQSRLWKEKVPAVSSDAKALRGFALFLPISVFCQLLLGAYVRHSQGAGVWFHISGAGVVLVAGLLVTFFVCMHFLQVRTLFWTAMGIISLITFQWALGFITFWRTISIALIVPTPLLDAIVVTLHQTVGATLLLSSVLFALLCYRLVTPPASSIHDPRLLRAH